MASSIPVIICRLQNKSFHLHYHKILVRVSFIGFSIRYTFYFFRVPLSKFRSTFYQVAELMLVSFFSSLDLNIGEYPNHNQLST